jgi:hypothetical protein
LCYSLLDPNISYMYCIILGFEDGAVWDGSVQILLNHG